MVTAFASVFKPVQIKACCCRRPFAVHPCNPIIRPQDLELRRSPHSPGRFLMWFRLRHSTGGTARRDCLRVDRIQCLRNLDRLRSHRFHDHGRLCSQSTNGIFCCSWSSLGSSEPCAVVVRAFVGEELRSDNPNFTPERTLIKGDQYPFLTDINVEGFSFLGQTTSHEALYGENGLTLQKLPL